MVTAETPRLILQHLGPDDAVAMNAVFGDPEIMRFGEGVRDPEWVTSWIAAWLKEYYPRWRFGAWAVVYKGTTTVIGYCGLSRFPGRCSQVEAELGFRLARAYWGRGLATEAATAVRDHAFAVLGVPRLIAHIDPATGVPAGRLPRIAGPFLSDQCAPCPCRRPAVAPRAVRRF